MADDRPEYEGEGPEKMMRDYMKLLEKSIPKGPHFAPISFVVSRAELVDHFTDREFFYREKAKALETGEVPIEVTLAALEMVHGSLTGSPAGGVPSGHPIGIHLDPRELEEIAKREIDAYRKRAIAEARDRARTYAFLLRHLGPGELFSLDLYSAATFELVPTALSPSMLAGCG